jgi:probable phosphoglycerate mutase
MRITFIRHGQSESNASGHWQGHSDSPLSALGRAQAKALGERLVEFAPKMVVASDLSRAADTAAALGLPVEHDEAWREIHLGKWEGMHRDEAAEQFGEELEAFRRGEPIKLGGGESLGDLDARVGAAFDSLLERLDVGDHAVVVAHGGVVSSLTRQVLGLGDRGIRPLGRIENTSISEFGLHQGTMSMLRFNDVTHLGSSGEWTVDQREQGAAVVSFIRHGQTHANVAELWHGHTDGPLTDAGHAQAEALSNWYQAPEVVYHSNLERARETAAKLAERLSVQKMERPDVIEMHLGDWEGLTTAEILTQWAPLVQEMFGEHKDVARGGSGETMEETRSRMEKAMLELMDQHPEEHVSVVSHAGSIKALALGVLGLGHAERDRMSFMDNTAISTFVRTDEEVRMAEYNVGRHLL